MGINERGCWQKRTLLDEYIKDMRNALSYADEHAGETIDDLDSVASEKDRVQMLKEEFSVLANKINELFDSYEDLARTSDEVISMLGGEN